MPEETFRIRIKRDGTILFHSRELDEEQTRRLREMIEDSLGPIKEIHRAEGDDIPPSVKLVDDKKNETLRHR